MKVRKFGNYVPQPLDQEVFDELLHILHSVLLNGNWAATARALGISKPTAVRWVNQPPKQNHWNMILRHIIRELTAQLRASPHKKHRIRARTALARLQELPAVKGDTVDVDWDPTESVREVLIALNEAPGQTLTSRELRRITTLRPSQLTAIAQRLCLTKETEGFGKDKVTHYSLPRDE